MATPTTTLQRLQSEEERLRKEMAALQADLTKTDPDGSPSLEAIQAQKRLPQLNDDYRQLLSTILTAEKPSAATRPTAVQGGAYGTWVYDDNNNLVQQIPPNADEEQKKAIENQNAAMLRNERQRNFDAKGTYATNAEVQNLQIQAQQQNLNEQEFNEKVRQFNISQQNKDREEARLAPRTAAETGLITAQAGETVSRTGLTNAQVAALSAKTPAEIAEMEARGDLSRAQAEEIRARIARPTLVTGAEGPTVTTMGPQGQITEQYRAGYVPKTQAEIAARTGQINALAQAKKAEIMRTYANDPDKGLAEFNTWYDQNVQPQIGALQAATEEAQFARAKDIASEQRQAYQQALAAGTGATQAFTAAAPYRVGPGYQQAFENIVGATARGERAKNVDMTGVAGWKGPDVEQMRQQAVNEALKYISPGAAQAAGAPLPNYQAINPAEALARTNYLGPVTVGAGPAAAAPAGAGGPPTAMPFGAIGANPMLAAQQAANRQAAGRQLTAATAQAGLPAIGSNPMQAAMEAYQAQQAAAAAIPAPAPSQPWGSSDYQGIRRAPVPAVPYSDAAARMASGMGAGGVGPTGPMPEPFYPTHAEMGPAYTLGSVTPQSQAAPYGQVGEPSVSGVGTMGQEYTGIQPQTVPSTPSFFNPSTGSYEPLRTTPPAGGNLFGVPVAGLNIGGVNIPGVYQPWDYTYNP